MKKFLLLSTVLVALSGQNLFAVDAYNIPEANPAFEFNIYNQGETLTESDGKNVTSFYTMSENQRSALFDAAAYWDLIFNTTVDPNKLPTFIVTTIKDFNAFALSDYVPITGSDYLVTEINAFINGRKIVGEYSNNNGHIQVGVGLNEEHPGWNFYDGPTALYQEDLSNLYSIMVHEMYHTMGVTTFANQHVANDKTTYFSKDASSPISIWDKGLRIYKGSLTSSFDPGQILAADRGMSIRIDKSGNETFDIVNYSPYFVGLETLKVLTGQEGTEEELQAYIHSKGGLKNYSSYYDDSDSGYPKVLGLPVNVIEEGKTELSHIELRNSFMSHQSYRSWMTPMEAELAVLKDLGYINVDTRRFFGKSYYLNDITDTFSTGYGEWDGSSYSGYSTISNGVGLHIYGDNNTITQESDILSKGKYAIGARIDGTNNIYNVNDSLIDVKGDGSIGIAVAWGKNHTVNIDNNSSVKASGKGGIGVSFDYGKNGVFGGLATDEGSFSRYEEESKKNMTPDEENQSALVKNFNVNGTIKGDKAAIYISENAYVENINLNNNSNVSGDIISKWNSVKSGANMFVQRKGADDKWYPVNQEKTDEIYFTNLNFSGNTDVDGDINGSNDIFNTLNMTNSGNLNFGGDDLNVYNLKNTGVINFINSENAPELSVQTGSIEGAGVLNFQNGVELGSITYVENTANIGNTFISLSNGKAKQINMSKLNSDDANLYIDFGDSFILQNASDEGHDKINLKGIYFDRASADGIDEKENVRLFEETSPTALTANTLDVSSSVNFYYKNNKYTLSQDTSDKRNLSITKTEGSYELSDAIADGTTSNYIMTENDTITKDLGTVQSGNFEISGDDIDVNGHSGLVVDGSLNNKTILKTDIYGASDSNITLVNKANFVVKGDGDDIDIGKKGETSLTIDNSTFSAELENENLNIEGSINGLNTNTKNKVILAAKNINLDGVDNVAIATKSETLNLNNTMSNTIWQVEGNNINIKDDSYLSSDGSNSLIIGGGTLNFANNKTNDINLTSMTLNSDLNTSIDVDLGSLSTDRFVFGDSDNLVVNDHNVKIQDVNLLNSDLAFTEEKYTIPFVSLDYNNTGFLKRVNFENPKSLMTPIFKYNFNYEEIDTQGNWTLSRGSSSDYQNYNPSVLAGPVGAQVGGYLTQLNSYDEAFHNMDMYMLMTHEQRQALKFKNRYAASDSSLVYDSTLLRQENSQGWFRPYATFEKVGLRNGPNVESQSYGTFLGGESKLYDLGRGFDGMWGVYAGYNGSHQNYDGVSIYQNGGTLGLVGMAYKKNFFTGLTINSGANSGRASTMYGNDDFTMLMAGVASKTGYNFEFARGRFIIQPSWLMSYSFVNTFDYTNAAGVRINSDPLHAIQLQPELKFIGNLKNGWQPYASVAMVWNILDDTKFKANDVTMPEMSVKPYVKYGVGVRKIWGERLTGFFQTYITNGGRNGVGLAAGFTWSIGKSKKK